jgi:hypothetical protein
LQNDLICSQNNIIKYTFLSTTSEKREIDAINSYHCLQAIQNMNQRITIDMSELPNYVKRALELWNCVNCGKNIICLTISDFIDFLSNIQFRIFNPELENESNLEHKESMEWFDSILEGN